MVYFEITKGNNKKWHWRLVVGDETVATDNHGLGHATKEECKEDIRNVIKTTKDTIIYNEKNDSIDIW